MEKVLMDKESRNMRKRIMWGGGGGRGLSVVHTH